MIHASPIVEYIFIIDYILSYNRVNFTDIGKSIGRLSSVADMSFSLGSECKNTCVTCEKDFIVVNRMTDTIYLPHLFSLLDDIPSISSRGKC